jgi:hypothetical protein
MHSRWPTARITPASALLLLARAAR